MEYDSVEPVKSLGCGRIVLASASPRRQEIIAWLGLSVEIRPSNVSEEQFPGENPVIMAERLAIAKARGACPGPGEIAIGSDTIVVSDGAVLGKPGTAAEARQMLSGLRGRWHQVISGLSLVEGGTGRSVSGYECTRVRMRDYADTEITDYIIRGEPFDKAGAYAIQDFIFDPVEEIDGCYLNVVGLPICVLVEGLRQLGCDTSLLRLDNLPSECFDCRRMTI